MSEPEPWDVTRRASRRDSWGVGIATGAYGLSFGALAAAGGFSLPETCALSLLMFTGGSQFALVSTVSGGGSSLAGAATAILLGTRNALYGLSLSSLLRVRGAKRIATAQLIIDESTAMAVGQDTERASRLGFYTTGIAVFLLWNLATLVGGARRTRDRQSRRLRPRRRRIRRVRRAARAAHEVARDVDRRDRGHGRRARADAVRPGRHPGAVRGARRGRRRLAEAR